MFHVFYLSVAISSYSMDGHVATSELERTTGNIFKLMPFSFCYLHFETAESLKLRGLEKQGCNEVLIKY
jgi:hypothetical protein